MLAGTMSNSRDVPPHQEEFLPWRASDPGRVAAGERFSGSLVCWISAEAAIAAHLAAAVSINKKLAEPRPVLRLYGMEPAL